ncbi:MAG: hypothetical protein AB7D43_08925 [Sulfurimonadaceae bacterium]
MKKSMVFNTIGIVILFLSMYVHADMSHASPYLIEQGRYSYSLADWKQQTHHVNRPWFDASQKLQWDESAIDASRCNVSLHVLSSQYPDVQCSVKTHFTHPHLDECRCEYRMNEHKTGTWQSFIGGENNETWERHRCDKDKGTCVYLSDVTTSGIIFSDHEVWSIDDGKTLFSSQKTSHKQYSTSLYLPSSECFVEFEGESTLISSEGGLWIFDPINNKRELIDPIDDGLSGYWKVEKMSEIPDSKILILVERWATRGVGDLRLKLFDLSKRRTLGIHKLSSDGLYSDIHILHAKNNQVAVSFFDAKEYIVVLYRVTSSRRVT